MKNDFDPKTITKILIIDTEEEPRTLLRTALENDFLVLEAKSGIGGIDLALDTEPHLILIDIALMDLSGFEVATRFRTLLPNTPIVALFEKALLQTKDFALAVGFSGYITKPIDPDVALEEVKKFIEGKVEDVENRTEYLVAHQSQLASRVEEKVREMANVQHRAKFLIEQNSRIIETLQRSHQLLENAAHVAKSISSILDLDELLSTSVDIICERYNFYYAGIFLLDEKKEWAELRAGHGEAGKAMMGKGHKLEIGGHSMIGTAIKEREAHITLDVGLEKEHFKNPLLPDTRSEMALPLVVKDKALGAISIQSVEEAAFSDDDVTALQTLADQLAIAIDNALLLQDLDNANQELLRTKTYEAIATATGEAIHWVGNKAAPIPGSIARVREDLYNVLAAAQILFELPNAERLEHPFWPVMEEIFETLANHEIDLKDLAEELSKMTPKRLPFMLGIESILEDMQIVEQSANTILHIKEDLIGPARQHTKETIILPDMLKLTATGMGYAKGVIETIFSQDVLPVIGDIQQIDRVFINLIKNAWEAMDGQDNPKIIVSAESAGEPGFSVARVSDNGPGISPENLEKIWVSFFTTKKDKGGTGLGLSACMEIINQSGGKITVDSKVGEGTTFSVLLPVDTNNRK